jgi:hypothetical protein
MQLRIFHRTFIFTREDQISEPGTTGPHKSNGTNKERNKNQRTSIRENNEMNGNTPNRRLFDDRRQLTSDRILRRLSSTRIHYHFDTYAVRQVLVYILIVDVIDYNFDTF